MVTIEQLRRARERHVKAGGLTFIIRLLTDHQNDNVLRPFLPEMATVDAADDLTQSNFYRRYNVAMTKAVVIGWKGVRERDIVDAGTEDELPFSKEIFDEWIEDKPKVWGEIVASMYPVQKEQEVAAEEQRKN